MAASDRSFSSSSSVRPRPIAEEAADVVRRAARQPDAFARRQRRPERGHEQRPRRPRPVRRSRDPALEGARASPRDAGLGGLDLQRAVRLARLLDDEPQLHSPVFDVRRRLRQQHDEAVQARIGLSARPAGEAAVSESRQRGPPRSPKSSCHPTPGLSVRAASCCGIASTPGRNTVAGRVCDFFTSSARFRQFLPMGFLRVQSPLVRNGGVGIGALLLTTILARLWAVR